MKANSLLRTALLLCAAMMLLAMLGACSSKKTSKNGASTATAAGTPTPQELLVAAGQATQALNSFHFTLNHENGTTPIAQGISMRKADGDFLRPDRLRATVSGTVAQGFDVDVKVISIADQTWLALVDSRYLPLGNGVSASAILDPNNGVLKAVNSVRSPAYAGNDRINGVDTRMVTGTIDAGDLTALDSQAQAGKSVAGKVWIGATDHRVYRIRLEGPLNDQEPANIARQIDLSQFNSALDIQPPS